MRKMLKHKESMNSWQRKRKKITKKDETHEESQVNQSLTYIQKIQIEFFRLILVCGDGTTARRHHQQKQPNGQKFHCGQGS